MTMVGSAQPFFSKWWCSGAMAKTRLPVNLKEKTWTMTETVSRTNRPPTMASTSRSEEHTSELQSLMRISYAVFCFKKKKNTPSYHTLKQCTRQEPTTLCNESRT